MKFPRPADFRYIWAVEFEWDETKRQANLAKHRLDFADDERLDWVGAVVEPDMRFDYGEDRFRAFCMMEGELYSVAFTRRNGATRIVSFRHANRRERKLYVAQKKA